MIVAFLISEENGVLFSWFLKIFPDFFYWPGICSEQQYVNFIRWASVSTGGLVYTNIIAGVKTEFSWK